MNEKGEVTLISCLLILVLTGLVLLCGLELRKSFRLLEKRTHLFLCVKETRGELHNFMKFMGRSNWAIKNINRASLVMLFIPGLQAVALDAQKAKKYLQYVQEAMLVSYLKTLKDLKDKRCPLDPRMFITPFKLGSRLLKRDSEGAAILKEEKWNYYYFSKPYLISLEVKPGTWEKVWPEIKYQAEEKAGKLSSLLSSQF
jgi:hypothetical protein